MKVLPQEHTYMSRLDDWLTPRRFVWLMWLLVIGHIWLISQNLKRGEHIFAAFNSAITIVILYAIYNFRKEPVGW